jgi:hypothetical protein
MLWALGFLTMFTLGGISGVVVHARLAGVGRGASTVLRSSAGEPPFG